MCEMIIHDVLYALGNSTNNLRVYYRRDDHAMDGMTLGYLS